uniref:Uncharacterized protein n=1 Tax=Arundo donax TaxID=35708 RepID=A0A0A8XX21_ARUDO
MDTTPVKRQTIWSLIFSTNFTWKNFF